MGRIGIVGLILCLMIVTGCSDPNEKQEPQNTSYVFQNILDKADITPRYLDTSKYSGEELDIVKCLNLEMKYSLENNLEGVLSLYSKEHLSKNNEPNQDVLSIIVSLDNAQFNHLSDTEIETNVVQSQIAVEDPNATISSGTKRYFMIKENNEWKILSVQN